MPEDLGIPVELSPAVVRSIGPEHVGRSALDRVGDKYWVHLDVDVLDQREFSATDYPNSSGLSLDDAAALLRPLTMSPGMIGFSLGCYNPDLDPDGDGAPLPDRASRQGLAPALTEAGGVATRRVRLVPS